MTQPPSRPAASRLPSRLALGFAALVAVLVAVAVVAFANFRELADARRWNVHSYAVLAQEDGMVEALGEEETAARALAQRGDPAMRERRAAAQREFAGHMRRARRLTRDNPAQTAHLERLSAMHAAWAARPAPTTAAEAGLAAGGIEAMRALLREFDRAETRLLRERAEHVATLERATGILLAAGAVFAVLLATGLAWMVTRRTRGLHEANHALAAEIAERKLAQRAAERLGRENDLILDAVEDGIYGVDVHGYTTFLNPAAARLLGHDATEVIGRPLEAVLQFERDAEGAGGPEMVRETLRTGQTRRVAGTSLRHASGSRFPAEFTSTPLLEDGRIVGAVVTFRDVTERNQVDRMKDEFVSVVSHELRTPLTSIRGSLGLLASGQLGELNERGRRLLEIAQQNTDRLVRLINDILDIERIESGKAALELHPHDAAALARAAAEVMEPMAERAGVALRLRAEPVPVVADADRILQVLTNLVSNAVKFSPAGSEVELAVAPGEGGAVTFEVRDRGRGIPPEKLESVFERFQQVDSSDSRQKGGTGLGLAISRSIVQQHGGRIWAESRAASGGGGSVFRFTLPGAPDGAHPASAPAASGPRVLVCAADPAERARAADVLEAWGYRVSALRDVAAVLGAASADPVGAILLDASFSTGGTAEALERLRAHPATLGVPVVVMGGSLPPGAAARVEKPVEAAALVRVVEEVLPRPGRRVLLVEDDDGLARVLSEVLARHGVEPLHAATGEEAVEMAGRAAPDLVVLDVALPGRDGFWVVESLRGLPALRDLPLVVYAAQEVEPGDRARLRLGETEFLTKGRVGPEELERRVMARLNRRHPRPAAGDREADGYAANPGG